MSNNNAVDLRIEGLNHGFKSPHGSDDGKDIELSILRDLDLTVKTGESLAILGPSGSGKSTLLGLMAGLDTPTLGNIELLGTSIANLNEDGRAKVRASGVGFVFQSFQLLPALTALENVMLPLELSAGNNAKQHAQQWLEQVGLSERLDHYPSQLSGGEQQRVALARAFAVKPLILFADEPTGNLDRHTGLKIADLMFELQGKVGVTLILVTHDETLAGRCERRVYLQDGQLEDMK